MSLSGRVGKAETVTFEEYAHAVPCATHALGRVLPDPKDPDDRVVGGCHECGEPIEYTVEGLTPREREVAAELYGVGTSLATLSASPRAWLAFRWFGRQGRKKPKPPYTGLARALDDEALRRFVDAWTVHIKTVSNEMLELMADKNFDSIPDAELEAIILPPVQANVATEDGRQLNVA